MKRGMLFIRRPAEAQQPLAMCDLGEAYLFGNGVEKDEKAANFWLRKSAEVGHPKAQQILASIY